MREAQNHFSLQNFIVHVFDHDSSSKLCFEKEIIKFMVCNKYVIFKVF